MFEVILFSILHEIGMLQYTIFKETLSKHYRITKECMDVRCTLIKTRGRRVIQKIARKGIEPPYSSNNLAPNALEAKGQDLKHELISLLFERC